MRAKVMMAWVTDVPNMNGRTTPLKYRFLVAMQGSLGIGANLNKWSDDGFQAGDGDDRLLQEIRETVQKGKLYRLFSPREGEFTANQYVSQDGKQAVLFAFLHSQQYLRSRADCLSAGAGPRSATYRVRPLTTNCPEPWKPRAART